MPDTPRTVSALQTLFADNTNGDISPQDLRDFLVSVMGRTKRVYLPAQMFILGTGAALASVGSSANGFEDMPVWAFDAAADEYVLTSFMMPADWDGGAITPRIHWAPSNTNTGTVLWRLVYGDVAAGDQIDEGFAQVTLDDAGDGTAEARQVASGGTFTPAQAFLRLAMFRLGADAGDTYNADAWGMGVELEYTAAF